MRQYSRILADSIRDWRLQSGVRGYFHEQEFANNQWSKQTGAVGRTDIGVPQQRSERQGLVQGKRSMWADILEVAASFIWDVTDATGNPVCRGNTGTPCPVRQCSSDCPDCRNRGGYPFWGRCSNRRNGVADLEVMLSEFTGAERVYIACGYTDLRRGIDGLAALVQQQFHLDPFTNTLFLFCGRRRDRIKALYWEGNGFVLLYKRLESGSFQWLRKESEARALTPQQYRWLMEGLSVDQPKAHKPVSGLEIV